MDIRFMSDLHFEFHRDGGKSFVASLPDGGDVLVVAGDIGNVANGSFQRGLSHLAERFKDIVVVLGNHEYYGATPSDVAAACRNLPANVHLLNRGTVTISGVRFVGCTLWYPDGPMNFAAEKGWSDFAAIKGARPFIYDEARKDAKFLRSTVRPGDVVVTHYLPSHACVAPNYRGNPTNIFFVHPVDDVIGDAAVWIHGHTHDTVDKTLGDTRVVCNPFGYVHRGETGQFRDDLVIHV